MKKEDFEAMECIGEINHSGHIRLNGGQYCIVDTAYGVSMFIFRNLAYEEIHASFFGAPSQVHVDFSNVPLDGPQILTALRITVARGDFLGSRVYVSNNSPRAEAPNFYLSVFPYHE